MNAPLNPNYIEDVNGSDYVCMTRATPQSASKMASLNPVSTLSANSQPTTSNSTALQLTSKNLQTLQQEHLNAGNSRSQLNPSDVDKSTSISPTPSQVSNNSNNREYQMHFTQFHVIFSIHCCSISRKRYAVIVVQCNTSFSGQIRGRKET